MAKIIWTEESVSDINDILDFISNDSPKYAKIVGEKLVRRVEGLRNFSRSGRIVPEFDRENLRELIEAPYRIIYEIKSEEEIWIIRIHHSARLLKSL